MKATESICDSHAQYVLHLRLEYEVGPIEPCNSGINFCQNKLKFPNVLFAILHHVKGPWFHLSQITVITYTATVLYVCVRARSRACVCNTLNGAKNFFSLYFFQCTPDQKCLYYPSHTHHTLQPHILMKHVFCHMPTFCIISHFEKL